MIGKVLMLKWSEMFPDGRYLFYEGDNPEGFAKEMRNKYAFDPKKDNLNWSDGYGFWCPSRLLDEVYGSGSYPLGS
jgi:hypothetical protein